MMKSRVALAIAVTVMFLLPVGNAYALDGYDYYVPIDITNGSGAEITGRMVFTVNAAGLIDGYYMQGDAGDVRLTDGTTEPFMAGNLSHTAAAWYTDRITVPANSVVRRNLWMGNETATLDQQWIADAADTVTVTDAASLDITGNLTISADVNIATIPSGDAYILNKTGAYWLKVGGNDTLAAGISATESPLPTSSDGYIMAGHETTVGARAAASGDVGNATGTTGKVGQGFVDTSENVTGGTTSYPMQQSNRRYAARVGTMPASVIKEVKFNLTRTGNPTGTCYVRVRDSDNNILGTLGSIDSASIAVGFAWYTFSDDVVIPTAQQVRISFENSSGDGVDYLTIRYHSPGPSSFYDSFSIWNGAAWVEQGGDDANIYLTYRTFECYRSYVYFDTSSLSDAAVIYGATLKLYGSDDQSDTDFLVVIQNGQPTYPHDPLVLGDYDRANYSGDGGNVSTASWDLAGYNTIALNEDGLDWIRAGNTTKLCLRSSRDISDTGGDDDEYVTFFLSEAAGTATDPQLTVIWGAEASATVAEDTDYSVKATYDGSDLKLYLDSVEQDSVACAGTITSNANNVALLDFDGRIDDLMLGSTSVAAPTWNLNLQFEPDQISNNTISDQSASTNDASFVLAGNPAGITVTVYELTAASVAEATAATTETVTGLFTSAPPEPTNFYPATDDWGNLPGSDLLEDLTTASGTEASERIPLGFVWLATIAFGLVAIGYFIYHHSKHTLPVAIIVTVALVFCAATIPSFGFWMLAPYLIVAISALISERQYGY